MIEGKERHDFVYKWSAKFARRYLCHKFNFEYDVVNVGYSPYIVISNHLTNWDPLLIAMSFKKSMYYLASDVVYRLGVKSKLLRFLFSPIARARSALETSGVLTIFKRLRGKANICIFEEGNNSFDGETGEIQPSIGRLIKRAGVAMVTYRFTGTYFTFPRWSRFIRKGKTEGRLVQIYSPETLASMTEEDIYEAIKKDIYANAYEEQKKNPVSYRGRKPAESLETALYCCPACYKFATLKSKDDKLFCKCGFEVIYNDYGYFETPDKNTTPPFTTILDWSKWQRDEVVVLAKKMLSIGNNVPIFADTNQRLYVIKRASYNTFMAKGSLHLYTDRLSFVKKKSETIDFPLDTIVDLSVIFKTNIIFSTSDGKLYEIHSNHPMSATKYLEMIKALKGNGN